MRLTPFGVVAALHATLIAVLSHAQEARFNLEESLARLRDAQAAYESKLRAYLTSLASDGAVKPADRQILEEALKLELEGFRAGAHTSLGTMPARSVSIPPLNKPELVTPPKEQAKYVDTRTKFIAYLEAQAGAVAKADAALASRIRAAAAELQPKRGSPKAVPVFTKQISKRQQFQFAGHDYLVAQVDGSFDFNKDAPKLAKELEAVLAPLPNSVTEVTSLAQETQKAMSMVGMDNITVQTGATCSVSDRLRIRNGNELVDKSVLALMEPTYRNAEYYPAWERVCFYVAGASMGNKVELRRNEPASSLKYRMILFQLGTKAK